MSRVRANLMLLAVAGIWGMAFVAQSTAMDAIGPLLFVGLRSLLACVVLLPIAWRESLKVETPLEKRSWVGFGVIGLVLFMAMITQQLGLLTTTVTNSGFFTGLYVIFTPILTVIFLRKRPHHIVWPAAILTTGGVYLMSGGELDRLKVGDFLTILSAVFWAVQIILIGQLAKSMNRPIALCFVQFAVCAVLGLVSASFLEVMDVRAMQAALPQILYAGGISSALAFTLQAVAQRHTTAPQAAIFMSSEALFAALFGAVCLGEHLVGLGYLGCTMMFLGMLLVEIVRELGRRSA